MLLLGISICVIMVFGLLAYLVVAGGAQRKAPELDDLPIETTQVVETAKDGDQGHVPDGKRWE